MSKILLLVITTIVCVGNVFGQVHHEVLSILETKNYAVFKQYIDTLKSKERNIRIMWECLRDLTGEYQEGVVTIDQFVAEKNNPSKNSVRLLRISFISTETDIALYVISERHFKKVALHWVPYYVPINNYRDELAIDRLKRSFRSIYHADLNESELFITDFKYGDHCTLSGSKPKGRELIDELVAMEDRLELLNWLKSTNTERQIYAVDGLLQLRSTGKTLTEEELRLMRYVTSKKGTVYACEGCTHWRIRISLLMQRALVFRNAQL